MDTKIVQEKLQNAYKSMLEHVEELVDKDKKPLKEAFEEAEEKLSEWQELSREEVSHISEELKSNLSDVGEASHKLNESLKETLSFDASYLASSVWNRLSKVADQTIVELSELGESLQRHTVTDASNYSDQQQVWLKDAALWHGNYEDSLKQLDSIRADIRKKIRQTNTYSKAVTNAKVDQSRHDLLAQENQEITQSVNNIFHQYFGEKL
jgi:hypothetical protein